QPGSRVFFKRGGVCRGPGTGEMYTGVVWNNRSGTTARNIEYRAYGEGPAPIISGAIAATGWQQHSGNIYRTNIGANRPIKYVFVGNEPQTLARTPNKNSSGDTVWLRTDNMNGIDTGGGWGNN